MEEIMRTITLGRSGLTVSRIAFGTWQLGGDWGATDEIAATAAIRQALDQGVTFFDTAQAYGFGVSERLLGNALRVRPRDELVIASKGGLRPSGSGVACDASAAWIRSGVEESLRALDTEYIDLYQIHWPDPKTPFSETAEALAKLIAEGKIHHVGVSNFNAAQMEAFSRTLPVETLQPPYHLFHREIENETLPYAAAHNIGVVAYGPLAHGLLGGQLTPDIHFAPGDWRAASEDFQGASFERNLRVVAQLRQFAGDVLGVTLGQLAIAWTLANPAVHVAIVGTRNPAHVGEALAAAEVDLEPGVLERIEEIVRPATPIAGPSPESV
jgi:aryl-alcohol dehydrogenase-like predicted oxidoreductase